MLLLALKAAPGFTQQVLMSWCRQRSAPSSAPVCPTWLHIHAATHKPMRRKCTWLHQIFLLQKCNLPRKLLSCRPVMHVRLSSCKYPDQEAKHLCHPCKHAKQIHLWTSEAVVCYGSASGFTLSWCKRSQDCRLATSGQPLSLFTLW